MPFPRQHSARARQVRCVRPDISDSNPTVSKPVVMAKVHDGRAGENSLDPSGDSIARTELSRGVSPDTAIRSRAPAASAMPSAVAAPIRDLERLKSMGEPLISGSLANFALQSIQLQNAGLPNERPRAAVGIYRHVTLWPSICGI